MLGPKTCFSDDSGVVVVAGNKTTTSSSSSTPGRVSSRYSASVASLQPAWKNFSVARNSSGNCCSSAVELKSPRLLKTAAAFMFAESKDVDNKSARNSSGTENGGIPGAVKSSEGAQAAEPSAGSEAVVSGRLNPSSPPPKIISAVKSSSTVVPEQSSEELTDSSDSAAYKPRFSVSAFREAFDVHASRMAANTTTNTAAAADSSSSSLTSSGGDIRNTDAVSPSITTTTNGGPNPRVIIHKITKSILKPKKREAKARVNNVCFPPDADQQLLVEVIGYGGDETYFSGSDDDEDGHHVADDADRHHPAAHDDDDDDDDDEDLDIPDDDDVTPDERRLRSLTDKNTDYNGNPTNLLYGQVPDENQVETVSNPADNNPLNNHNSSNLGCHHQDVIAEENEDDEEGEVAETKSSSAIRPKVSAVKPFCKPSSWLYKQSSDDTYPKSLPVQHVAPLVDDAKPADTYQENLEKIQRFADSCPKPPILPKPKVAAKPSLSLGDGFMEIHQQQQRKNIDVPDDDDDDDDERVVVDSSSASVARNSRSLHDLLETAANALDSPENARMTRSFDALESMETFEKPSAKPWESSSDSSDVDCNPQMFKITESPDHKQTIQLGDSKNKPLQRSNSDLVANVTPCSTFVMGFASTRLKHHQNKPLLSPQSNGAGAGMSSTKRPAPQPPQRRMSDDSPASILRPSPTRGRHSDKRAATLSPGTNAASVQFLLDSLGAGTPRTASPSPRMKKKQRRSRSLPRPSDLFLASETNPSGFSRGKTGCFSPKPENRNARSTAKKKTKNFIMKLLKRGGNGNKEKNVTGKGTSNKYSFEPQQNHHEEKRSRLQIVHPLDIRKSDENGNRAPMPEKDVIVPPRRMSKDDSNHHHQHHHHHHHHNHVVNGRSSYRKLPDLDDVKSNHCKQSDGKAESVLANGRKLSDSSSSSPALSSLESPDLYQKIPDVNGSASAATASSHAMNGTPSGRPKPPPPPRSSSNRGNAGDTKDLSPIGDGSSYANLGGARQSITPTKPDRSNSIRETSNNCRPTGSALSKRESPDVEPPPPPIATVEPETQQMRRASPYAVSPCANIDAPGSSALDTIHMNSTTYNVPRSHPTSPSSPPPTAITSTPLSAPCPDPVPLTQIVVPNVNASAEFGNKSASTPLSTFVPPSSRTYASRLSLRAATSPRGSGDGEDSSSTASSTSSTSTAKPSARALMTLGHKRSLEVNYGAVVAANHQALAQLLDQVQDHVELPENLRVIQDSPELRWSNFTVLDEFNEVRVGRRLFLQAEHDSDTDVTLMVCGSDLMNTVTSSPGRSQSGRSQPFLLPSTRGFVDTLPRKYLVEARDAGGVHVLPRMTVTSLQNFREAFQETENYEKGVVFVMLQLVSALKHLQAQGIEELDASLDNFVISTSAKESEFRLILLCDDVISLLSSADHNSSISSSVSTGKLSLCQTAVATLLYFLGVDSPVETSRGGRPFRIAGHFRLSSAFACAGDLLLQERAGSLTHVKSLLEFLLWGPDADEIDPKTEEQELVDKMLHQWLDLERAHVLNNLIRTQATASRSSNASSPTSPSTPGIPSSVAMKRSATKWLTIFEEYQLMFLVRTSVKTIKDVMFVLACSKYDG
ncbi:unnamed protein product [Notodromas monacha]|uniref:Uncharacterized protein n=1 Tax=Notodromas monacha TaxID=399045 RepID=A0A7R9BTT2_9CRUS|nr:unnamed protein product [Notodromas monacha]CAG0920570.1 unnamed protein product [Notodromas monacha]